MSAKGFTAENAASKFEMVVRVVTACTRSADSPRVSASIESGEWVIRLSGQAVVYKGATLDLACESLLQNWDMHAAFALTEFATMQEWLRQAYPK